MDPEKKRPVQTDQFEFGPWKLTSSKSHILRSEGPERERFESQLRLPQVPEMIFADNILRLEHQGGFGLSFSALDALKLVDPEHDLLKVAVSQAWRQARADCEHINEVVKPFDWTFTTDYKGTLFSDKTELKVTETDERIDIEKLKEREKIQFYADLPLFEDELADNGVSSLSVKIRVMPSGFFVLLRLHMRVDNVLIRINDTRIYHQAGSNFMLREFSSKERKFEELQIPHHLIIDPVLVNEHLKIVKQTFEKIEFPVIPEGTQPTAST